MKLVAHRAYKPGTPSTDATLADAAWFKAHPRRKYRVRTQVEGEFDVYDLGTRPPLPGAKRYAVVKQLVPGARIRLPCWAILNLPPEAIPESSAKSAFMHAQRNAGTRQWVAV